VAIIASFNNSIMRKPFEVTVLGTSSATPTKFRHPSSQFVRLEGNYMLLDCGEGTQRQLARYGLKMQRISHVFITHLHGDHYFGLPGLITSMALFGRVEPLIIVGPPSLESMIGLLLVDSDAHLPFELQFVVTQTERVETVIATESFEVQSVPLQHRVPCTGFLVREVGPQRKLNLDACFRNSVPVERYDDIKWGSDYVTAAGEVIGNDSLTIPGYKNRVYAYITDTIYDESLIPILKDVDRLYHEATFAHDRLARAQETFHSTAAQAAEIAKLSGAKQLLLGHFSARYQDAAPLIEEARTVFPNAEEAVEGETYTVGVYEEVSSY
jgi:ribonuclease Z